MVFSPNASFILMSKMRRELALNKGYPLALKVRFSVEYLAFREQCISAIATPLGVGKKGLSHRLFIITISPFWIKENVSAYQIPIVPLTQCISKKAFP